MTPTWIDELDVAAVVDTRLVRILASDIHEDDYLPVPPELREAVRHEAVRLKSVEGVHVDHVTQHQMLMYQTLHHHYAGREIACMRTDRGVIVLAVGPDEVSALLKAVPPHRRAGVVIEYP